jgi:hypothetical protein
MVEFDSITVDEDRRVRDPISHPPRAESSIENAVEGMVEIESERERAEALGIRNNLDNFVRDRVGNHNTNIGLMNNPTVNNVRIGEENYEVVSERFFELNQFGEFGDISDVQFVALSPQGTWDIETPNNRGEHAVAQGDEIAAYDIRMDGVSLDWEEIQELGRDVRTSIRTHNDFSNDGARFIAEYSSIEEAAENEDGFSIEDIERELEIAEHRDHITEDYNLTLKGFLSFANANARGITALEQLEEFEEGQEIDAGDFLPTELPPFGTYEGAIESGGQMRIDIGTTQDIIDRIGGFNTDFYFDLEEESYEIENKFVEKLMNHFTGEITPESLTANQVQEVEMEEVISLYFDDYSEENTTVKVGENIQGGHQFIYRLLDTELAEISDFKFQGIELTEPKFISKALRRSGQSLEEVEEGLSQSVDDWYNRTPDAGEDALYNDFHFEFEELDNAAVSYLQEKLEDFANHHLREDHGGSFRGSRLMIRDGEVYQNVEVNGGELLVKQVEDELEEYGFDQDSIREHSEHETRSIHPKELLVSPRDTSRELIDRASERVEEFLEDEEESPGYDIPEFNEEGGLPHYEREDFYIDGEIRNPYEMDTSVREYLETLQKEGWVEIQEREILGSMRFSFENVEEAPEYLVENLKSHGIDVTEENEIELGTHMDNPYIEQIHMHAEEVDIDYDKSWRINLNPRRTETLSFSVDAQLDEIDIDREEMEETPAVINTNYQQESMSYRMNDELRRCAEALSPFNRKEVPYSEVEFQTEFSG